MCARVPLTLHHVALQHACGFVAWNSSLTSYEYSVSHAPHAVDVVRPFVASAQAAGVGYGFYYSTVSNQYCNVCSGVPYPAGPGQRNVTQAEYDAIVLYHLKELWGLFGPLAEVWFDGVLRVCVSLQGPGGPFCLILRLVVGVIPARRWLPALRDHRAATAV